ncbi:ArsR/SmtB family transcription factor [Catellatospora bangladeshensis]|nr:helix-turn-helix domain-containing protein [Catellatospora bangladeshensis]
MWELALSMHHLRYRNPPVALAPWKQRLAGLLQPQSPLRTDIDLLLAVNPAVGYFPDLLTPSQSRDGFEHGVQAVLATSKRRLGEEITRVARPASAQDRVAMEDLRSGRTTAVRALGTGLRQYKRIALDPYWDRLVTAFDADRVARARQLLSDGLGPFLSHLHPTARFRDAVLHITNSGTSPVERDLHLAGRGLTLIPSYFKRAASLMVLADESLPPVLVYPIDRDLKMMAAARHSPLARLLGETRARVLECVEGLSTSEIAARLTLSPPAVSRHLTALRNAGLVAASRYHNSVVHTPTPLGRTLLEG